MRRPSKYCVLTIISIGIVCCFFGCTRTGPENRLAERVVLHEEEELAQFEKVHIGMTAAEMDAILGRPCFVYLDCRYYGHTPRIRAIDSPYSPKSIIIHMGNGRVVGKEYVPDHPDAPGSMWSWSNEADGVLERIDREWRARWAPVDDQKSLYSRKAFAAEGATVGFGEIEAMSVLAALQDQELSEKYADVLPWMLEPLLMYLVRGNDTPRMVTLLSVECPQYIHYDIPIEEWLACNAPMLGCPHAFGSLLAAWGESTDLKNRAAVAESLRASWASMDWGDVDSDEEMVARFSAWYENNRDAYVGNDELTNRNLQGADMPRQPLFVPK